MRCLIPFSVLALIGCGASTGVQRVEPMTETTTTTSATTTSTARLDEGEGSFSFHPSQWALESIEPGAKALWVRDAAGGCDQFDHAEVTESPKAVTITVINRFLTGEFACTADLRASRVRVELPSPLHGRKILGECTPGDDTPQQRICDAMHQAADASPEHS
jgi:hypothetical protein